MLCSYGLAETFLVREANGNKIYMVFSMAKLLYLMLAYLEGLGK